MDVFPVSNLLCSNAEKTYNDIAIKYYGLSSCREDMSEIDYRENLLMIDLYKSGYSCSTINLKC